jgi:hypothetical protein
VASSTFADAGRKQQLLDELDVALEPDGEHRGTSDRPIWPQSVPG